MSTAPRGSSSPRSAAVRDCRAVAGLFQFRGRVVPHARGFRRYARSGEEAGHAWRGETGHGRKGHVKIEEGVRLAKLTTVGIGGPARALARPQSLDELGQALAWAAE